MIGTTLGEIRRYVDAMADEEGSYYVVCSRTANQPVPLAGKRFVSRSSARSALAAAEQYRVALRSYDPYIPYYDLIVCEADDPPSASDGFGTEPEASAGWHPAVDRTGGRPRIDFCHDVTAALFEALVSRGVDDVETEIMDRYLERAERVADPDELCLRLLETAVSAVDRRLTPEEQRRLFEDAVGRLPPASRSPVPIERTLTRLVSMTFVEGYTVRRVDDESDRASTVTLRDYALDAHRRRVPTLPFAIDLRRRYGGGISIRAATHRGGDDWQLDLRLTPEATAEGEGLFCVPMTDP